MTAKTHSPELPSHEQVRPVDVVGSLGIAQELLATQGSVRPFKAWLGVSTKEETYPNEMVVGIAEWAEEHTGGLTVIVSDWLNSYNHAALRGNYDRLHEGAHVESMERNAQKRVRTLQDRFAEQGISARVATWSGLILDELEPKDDFGVNYGFQLMAHASQHNPQFDEAMAAVVHKHAGRIRERAIEAGHGEQFVDGALKGYVLEEVFFTAIMAEIGGTPIKLGPAWERDWDEVTDKYMHGGYGGSGAYPRVDFGAVYLEQK
ncbi:MAG TPA: hypothetical protein VIJ68_04145 [Candidatus Saccharimonadales bacterium]